mmetsp:Transcript_6340/g.15784  ORF Transcript_6340/g.15784 Transcript_6340/m.15784 type:complete len:233 (+) Transcript_6340:448-1146(+)
MYPDAQVPPAMLLAYEGFRRWSGFGDDVAPPPGRLSLDVDDDVVDDGGPGGPRSSAKWRPPTAAVWGVPPLACCDGPAAMSPLWLLSSLAGETGDDPSLPLLRLLFKLLFRLVSGVAVLTSIMPPPPSFLDGLPSPPPPPPLLPLFLMPPIPNLPNRFPFLTGELDPPAPLPMPLIIPPPPLGEEGASLNSKRGVGSGKSKTRLELGLAATMIFVRSLFFSNRPAGACGSGH